MVNENEEVTTADTPEAPPESAPAAAGDCGHDAWRHTGDTVADDGSRVQHYVCGECNATREQEVA